MRKVTFEKERITFGLEVLYCSTKNETDIYSDSKSNHAAIKRCINTGIMSLLMIPGRLERNFEFRRINNEKRKNCFFFQL